MSRSDQPAEPPPIGSLLSGWRLEEVLGRGGGGVVYRAVTAAGAEAALKIFCSSDATSEGFRRFRREVQTLARIQHPGVVEILGEALDHDPPYFCMELLAGGSLASRLERGPLAADALARLALELAEGLAAAHELQILHRDIKPQNVLFAASGQAKLADFGMARALDATTLTAANQIMGTLPYLAPEILRGRKADARTDLYQLGMTLFESATRRRPFTGEELMDVIGGRPLPKLPDVKALAPSAPPWLPELLGRLITDTREERIQTARTLIEELKRPRPRRASSLTRIAPPTPPAPTSPRARSPWTGWLAVLVLGSLPLLWVTSRPSPKAPEAMPAAAAAAPVDRLLEDVSRALALETEVGLRVARSPREETPPIGLALSADTYIVGTDSLLEPRLLLSSPGAIQYAQARLEATPPIDLGAPKQEGAAWSWPLPAGSLRDGPIRWTLTLPPEEYDLAKLRAQLAFRRSAASPGRLARNAPRPQGRCPPDEKATDAAWAAFRAGRALAGLKVARALAGQYPQCEQIRITSLYYVFRVSDILTEMKEERFGLLTGSFMEPEMLEMPAWKLRREADGEFAALAAAYPGWSRPWALYGLWLREAGELTSALRLGRWAVMLEPADAEGWLLLAETENAIGRPGRAGASMEEGLASLRSSVEHVTRALEIGTLRGNLRVRAVTLRAQLLDFMGRQSEARDAYAEVVKLDPKNAAAGKALERLQAGMR